MNIGRIRVIYSVPSWRFKIRYTIILLSTLFVCCFPSPGHADEGRPTIVIIGATARTAETLVPIAIGAGHKVIGIARRPDAVTISDERLTIVKGDVYDRASLEAVLTGTEIVVAVFGPRVDMSQEIAKTDLFSTGYTNVIEAMKANGNSWLVAISSIGAQKAITQQPADDAPRAEQWLWQVRGIYEDMRRMEEIVGASGLNFTILRPAQLMPEPARGDLQIVVDQDAPDFRLITYADFAQFILDEVKSGYYIGRNVGLFSDRRLQYGVNFMSEE